MTDAFSVCVCVETSTTQRSCPIWNLDPHHKETSAIESPTTTPKHTHTHKLLSLKATIGFWHILPQLCSAVSSYNCLLVRDYVCLSKWMSVHWLHVCVYYPFFLASLSSYSSRGRTWGRRQWQRGLLVSVTFQIDCTSHGLGPKKYLDCISAPSADSIQGQWRRHTQSELGCHPQARQSIYTQRKHGFQASKQLLHPSCQLSNAWYFNHMPDVSVLFSASTFSLTQEISRTSEITVL